MIIKKIKLENFKQFKGEQEINFSINPKNNVTIVYGEDTYGKTTLMQAFKWVLYNNIENKKILNFDIANNLGEDDKVKVSVEVEIMHEGKLYKFKRTKVYTKRNGNIIEAGKYRNVYKFNTSYDTWEESKVLNEYENLINKMLPEKLSEYFFFDGNKIVELSEETKRKNELVAKSIKDIIGLDTLINTLDVFKSKSTGKCIINSFKKELVLDPSNQEEQNILTDRMNEIENKPEEIEKTIEELNKEIEKDIQIKDKNYNYTLSNTKAKKIKDEMDDVSDMIDKLTKSKENKVDGYFKDFSNKLNKIYLKKASEQLKYVLTGLKEDEIGIPQIKAEAINYLLERGVCICGKPIHEGDEMYNHLMEEKKKLPPVSTSTSIEDFKKDLNTKSYFVPEELKANFDSTARALVQLTYEIDNDKTRKENLEEELANMEDVAEAYRNYDEAKSRIANNEEEIIKYNEEKEDIIKEYKLCQRKLEKFALHNDKNAKTYKYIEYSKYLYSILLDKYQTKEEELRNDLEEKMCYYLNEKGIGVREVEISKDYNITLRYDNEVYGDIVSTDAKDLGTVKAIAFMEALVKVASKKLVDKISNKSQYPIILDAPFSVVDPKHIENAFKSLPKVADQIIIFSTNENREDYIKAPNNKIGKEYMLYKNENSQLGDVCTEIKEYNKD